MSNEELYHELAIYTLELRDREFIHQHAVDAFAAQNADERSKPIAVVFSLVGLYLHVEKNFSGRQVQRVHMQLAQRRKSWPRLAMPRERGSTTIENVLAAAPGPARDAAIHLWCAAVWEAWSGSRGTIADLLKSELGIE